METSEKLDRIDSTVTELRVSMAMMTGKLDAVLARLDGHDNRSEDVERRLRGVEGTSTTIPMDVEARIRTLERRMYGIPSVAAVLSIAGFVLAAWSAFRH